MKLFHIAIFASLFAPLAYADDPCITQYTMMHYAQNRCFDVERPLPDGTTFKIHGGFITKDLSQASTKPTIVLIPGGPGQSSEPLKVALQERELINGMWSPLGMNVVLFDPRGTGFSPLPKATTSYDKSVISSENMVADLKAVVDAISPDKPVFFLAHSAGGHTALRFAELFPGRVSKILLVSASKSSRQMAQMNIALFAKKSMIETLFLESLPKELQESAAKSYDRVEYVLNSQLKARILKKYIHPDLKKITPSDFRGFILKRMEADPTGKTALDLVEKYETTFAQIDSEGQLLVPPELAALKLKESDFTVYPHDTKEWIQITLMCGEGMTKEELATPTYYDGIDMHHFCGDVHLPEGEKFKEPNLSQIHTPIRFLSGQDDTQVPGFIAREIVRDLPNATLISEAGTGHIFFDNKPMVLYNSLEWLLEAK